MLVDFGTEIVGPAARIEEALRLADEEELDLAILEDIPQAAGQVTYPVAEVLGARGIPFVFANGGTIPRRCLISFATAQRCRNLSLSGVSKIH